MSPQTLSMPAPLCGIRFIVLTDGTVYENQLYECNKRLTLEEYETIFKHVTKLLCGNVPAIEGNGTMAQTFESAAF